MKMSVPAVKKSITMHPRLDPGIGSATVYRMVNLLEEIGAISRRNMYKIVRNPDCKDESVCTIELDDNTVQKLSKDSFNNVVLTGLKACGYIDKQEIERMFVIPVILNIENK